MGAIAFEQPVPLQFSQVVAKLVQAVGAVGKLEGGERGLMNLFDGPTADGVAAVK